MSEGCLPLKEGGDMAATRFDPLEAATAAGFRPGSPPWQREVRRLTQHRTQEQEWERAAERYRALWAKARPASPAHPYLRTKGVVAPADLGVAWWPRQLGERLLIPMKCIGRGAPLMNLQVIFPDGKKLFGRGARAARTRTTIGAEGFVPTGIMYVCEGWCTAWSVHHTTGAPVVVAFTAGNLLDVAVEMRTKYPTARIILAADNDRWGASLNPGVHHAREAAGAANAHLAIPDFSDLDGRPSDFNDLHLREGSDAVLYWLDPAHAHEAGTSAPAPVELVPPPEPMTPATTPDPSPPPPSWDGPEVDETPPPAPPDGVPAPTTEEAKTWLGRAPFRCLGYDRGVYYYLPRGTGQITDLTAAQHDRKWLLPLAPLTFWEHEFPARNGASWSTAADAMLRASERVGVFRPDRLHGRGCWPERQDDGSRGILLHLGDRLLAPGSKAFEDPERYQSPQHLIYERMGRLRGPSTKHVLTLDEARTILGLFTDLLWRDPASAYLLAGWTVLAPVCGALAWRPHVWITGERGCGKTKVQSKLVVPLLGDMVLEVAGQTTEAGIRQELRADALAVTIDEAEEDEAAGRRIQAVLALARQSSSETGARTLKGTVQGSAMQFRIRSMFCLASIGGAIHQEADKSRIALLQLRGASQVPREERREHWRRYAPRLEAVTPELGQALIARTLRLLRSGMLPESISVFRQAAAEVLGEARSGDQYGTLYAGAWTLMSDELPSASDARELLRSDDLETYQQDAVPEGRKALDMILQQIERVDTPSGPRSLPAGQLVDICCGRLGEVDAGIADRHLRQLGLRVDVEDGAYVLYVANSSEWIKRAVRETIYARGIRNVLLTLPGVEAGGQIRFHSGLKQRTIRIPYSLLE